MRTFLFSIILFGCAFNLKAQPSFSKTQSNDTLIFNWDEIPNQKWLGYNFWCNTILDWKIEDNKVIAHPFISRNRTAHITSHSIEDSIGYLKIQVDIQIFSKTDSQAEFGFLVGAGGSDLDSKTNNFVYNTLSPRHAHKIIISKEGYAELRDYSNDTLIQQMAITPSSLKHFNDTNGATIGIEYKNDSLVRLFVKSEDQLQQSDFFKFQKKIPTGNIALFYNSKSSFRANASFDNFKVNGDVFSTHFSTSMVDPILASFYTNTSDSLFVCAQLMPFKLIDSDSIILILADSVNSYLLKFTGKYDSTNYQLNFRIPLTVNAERFTYSIRYSGNQSKFIHPKSGTIRKSPIHNEAKIMALNCNGFTFFHSGGIDYKNLLYPYRQIKKGYKIQQPDVLTFLGDQIYESRPEAAIRKHPFCLDDYLYKWSIWCYSFREIMLNQPTIIMTDDHDVYQGNIWGNGGIKAKKSPLTKIPKYYTANNYDTWQQDNGGYFMGVDFVNMVTKSQTSHLPYPNNPVLKNGMINYYTSYQYGNLDFLILEDRKFKSAPSQNDFQVYNGFAIEDSISYNKYHNDSFKLLGKKQLEFLDKWVNQPIQKNESKIILTQSAYVSLTSIPLDYNPLKDRPAKKDSTPQKVSPDMDTNGWPKVGRDRALNTIGDHPVLFISGDQHIGAVIEVFDSSQNSIPFYSVPAIANTWPRIWWPENESNSPLGFFTDAFGNQLNVKAVSNPNPQAPYPNNINYKSPGFGIIQFNKEGNKADLHAYPLYFDALSPGNEFEGWPQTVYLKN